MKNINEGILTEAIYATVKGRKFGSWISDGGRSVGYAAGDLVENPVYILESLLRDALGIGTSEINTTSIDELGNTSDGRRNGWKFARSLTEVRNSLDVLAELAAEAGCIYIHDYANKEALRAIDHYNPSTELNNAHLIEENGKPLIRVRQTHVQFIRNEFYLNYRVNYGSGNRDRQLFITSSSHNLASNSRNDKSPLNTYTGLCTQSQSMYSKTERWTYDANWIRDDATAELFIKMMADWLAIRKWQISSSLWYSADTLKLEVGDQVLWVNDLLPLSVQNKSPQGVAAVPHTTGGAMADGTYYYVVTAVDQHGETKKSAEVSAVIAGGGGNGSVTISWTALPGATTYRIYGRTTASENLYFGTAGTSYDDIGGAGTGGTPATVAPAWFVSRISDPPKSGGRMQMDFVHCPTIFFF